MNSPCDAVVISLMCYGSHHILLSSSILSSMVIIPCIFFFVFILVVAKFNNLRPQLYFDVVYCEKSHLHNQQQKTKYAFLSPISPLREIMEFVVGFIPCVMRNFNDTFYELILPICHYICKHIGIVLKPFLFWV